MIQRKPFLIILTLLICSQAFAADRSIPFFSGTLDEIQSQAMESNQPYFVYFSARENRSCKRMTRYTWTDPMLNRFISKNFLAVEIDILEADFNLVQQFQVYAYPTILLFSPDGKVLGRASGYLAPTTVYHILKKHMASINEEMQNTILAEEKPIAPAPTIENNIAEPEETVAQTTPVAAEPQLAMATRSAEPAQSQPIIDMNPNIVMRGQSAAVIHLDIPGLEAYSLKRLAMEPGQDVFGLLVDSHTSYRSFEEKVKQYRNLWKGEIWVYAEEVAETPVYKLILGAYATKEEADIFAQAMYKFGKINSSILNIGHLNR
ncbi:MAG: thioredoxin family protein [Bacteroidia bacterium]